MKTIQLFILILLLCPLVKAQDTILKTDQTELSAKVVEVTNDEVKFKHFNRLDGPTYTLKKSEVFVIIYKDGTREKFTSVPMPFVASVPTSLTDTPQPVVPLVPSASSPTALVENPQTTRLLLTKLTNGRQYTFKSGDHIRLKNDDDFYNGNFSSYQVQGVGREKLLLTAGGTDYGMPYRNITGIKHKSSNAVQNIFRFGGALLTVAAYLSSNNKSNYGSYTTYGSTYYQKALTWEVPAYVAGVGMVVTSFFLKKPYLKFNNPNRFKWEVIPDNSRQAPIYNPTTSTR
ncbi:hypothetical protein [Spirosoma arcticum]